MIDQLAAGAPNALRIQRFKKRKLQLKDEITKLRDRTIPNIIA